MDLALVAEELEACKKRGRMPKAVMAVDLYGQCADYDAESDLLSLRHSDHRRLRRGIGSDVQKVAKPDHWV